MKSSKSILIATGIYPPEVGGPATYTVLVEHELRSRGWNVEVLPFRTVRFLPTVIRHIAYFFIVLVKAINKDFIYAQDVVSVGLPSLIAAKILNKKFIVRVPGDFAWEQSTQRFGVKDSIDLFQNKKYGRRVELLRSIQKFVVGNATQVIVPSEYFYNLVGAWGVSRERIKKIYNGVSVPDGLQVVPHGEKTIVSAGRLVSWKGFDDLINTIKDLPEYKLFIFGDGPDRLRLEGLIKEGNLGNRVFLMGQVDRKTLLSHIKGSSVFVLPSKFESFSFQLVESMMVGTPVVAYDIGNLSEIVKSNENGILIEQGNIEMLSKEIRNICENPLSRETLSQNAKRDSVKFSLENTVNELESILYKI